MITISTEDQNAIMDVLQRYGDTWSKRDAQGCASLYADDADLITVDGEVCTGPAAVADYYQRQLTGPYKNFTVSDMEVGPIRGLGQDTAAFNGSWQLHGLPGRSSSQLIRWTLVLRRDSHEWRIVMARFMAPTVLAGTAS